MKISIAGTLLDWYDPTLRNLPWKDTTDPYRIWLSEIILQQTRVDQGTPYYLKFIEEFPTVHDLASAKPDRVLKCWEGLGYYSRARNLHETAKWISSSGGVFPGNFKGLLQLKGVGEYTAAAIASFAYNEPVAVVDGNVYRFLARLTGLDTAIDTTAGRKMFRDLAANALDRTEPAIYNQAIMDFGALVCTPKLPSCDTCPFRKSCVALREGRVSELPVKSVKMKRRKRNFRYYIITDGRSVLLEQRLGNDIWKNLYQFPMTEIEEGGNSEGISSIRDTGMVETTVTNFAQLNLGSMKQVLSHQDVRAEFFLVEVDNPGNYDADGNYIAVELSELSKFAFPGIINRFMEKNSGLFH